MQNQIVDPRINFACSEIYYCYRNCSCIHHITKLNAYLVKFRSIIRIRPILTHSFIPLLVQLNLSLTDYPDHGFNCKHYILFNLQMPWM